MNTHKTFLFSAVTLVALGCAHPSMGHNESTSPARGILRVTNNSSEPIQVYETANGSDTFLRLVQAGTSETFPVANTSPGQAIYLKAKTTSGREYTSRDAITLAEKTCTRNYGAPTPVPGCEWHVP